MPLKAPVPNWPDGVRYLTAPETAPGFDKALVPRYCAHLPLPPDATPNPVRIKKITDPSHPAFGQFGLFALRKLPAHSWVVDYLGVVHLNSQSDPASRYDLSLERWSDDGVSVDANLAGNEARMLNDYRNIANKPNVVFDHRTGEPVGAPVLRMAIFVGPNPISKGSELLVSYGKAFWKAE